MMVYIFSRGSEGDTNPERLDQCQQQIDFLITQKVAQESQEKKPLIGQ